MTDAGARATNAVPAAPGAPAEDGRARGLLVRGTVLQLAGRLFGSACAFATLAVLSRALSVGEFGRYTFYIGLFGVLDALADFGTGHAAIQLTADRPDALRVVLARARRIRVAMGLLGVALVSTYALVVGEPGGIWIALAAFYPVTHALELSATVFKNRIAWRVPVLARTFASGARLGAVVVLVTLGVEHAPELVLATAIASSTANLLLHLGSRRHLAEAPAPGPEAEQLAARVLATAWPLGVGSLCAMTYFYVDGLFVRALAGDEALGQYNAAVRMLSFLIMAAQLASATALPWLVRAHGKGGLDRALATLGQPLLLAAGAGFALLLPFADQLLALAFGERFASAAPSLRWLFGAAVAVHAGAVFVTALVAVGRVRAYLVVSALGLAVNLALNAVLVPRLAIEGAAIATAATEASVAVFALVALSRVGARPLAQRPIRWFLGPAIFAVCAWFVGLG